MTEKELENKIQYPDTELPKQMRSSDVFGMFQTVSAVPTKTPINWQNQIQYYKSGGTLRIYFYDTVNNVWSYAALT